MAIKVIEYTPLGTGQDVRVVIEADTYEEVMSAASREAAIQEAARRGLPRPGVSMIDASPYPVDEKGEASEAVMFGKVPVAAYRMDYTVCSAP